MQNTALSEPFVCIGHWKNTLKYHSQNLNSICLRIKEKLPEAETLKNFYIKAVYRKNENIKRASVWQLFTVEIIKRCCDLDRDLIQWTDQSQSIFSTFFFSPGMTHQISLPQSVPSPELLDSPSPSSEVTKKSNSFKASSVSLSSLLSDSTLFLTIWRFRKDRKKSWIKLQTHF